MAASRAGSSRAGSRRPRAVGALGRVPRLAPVAAVRGGVAMSASAELSAQDALKQQASASSPGGPGCSGRGRGRRRRGAGPPSTHPQSTLNPPSTPCARPTTGGLARVAAGAGKEGVGEGLGRPLTTR